MSLPYVGGVQLTPEQALLYYQQPDIIAHLAEVSAQQRSVLAMHLTAAAPDAPTPAALLTPGFTHPGTLVDYDAIEAAKAAALRTSYSPDPRAGAIEITARAPGETFFPVSASPSLSAAPMALSLSGGLSSGFQGSSLSLSSLYSRLGYSGVPTVPTVGSYPAGTIGGVAGDICTQYGVPASICALGAAAVDRWLGGSGSGGGGGGGTQPGASTGFVACEPGYELAPDGTCRAVATYGGGGGTGTSVTGPPGPEGNPTVGAWGMPAIVPQIVGRIRRANGSEGLILKCPTRMVLGADNLCYMKPLAARYRKWRPAPRPPVSAEDARAIRLAASAKKRVKKLAGRVGFSCAPKGSRFGKR